MLYKYLLVGICSYLKRFTPCKIQMSNKPRTQRPTQPFQLMVKLEAYPYPIYLNSLHKYIWPYPVSCFIYTSHELGFSFHHYCVVYDVWKWTGTIWPECGIRLFAHHTFSLSSLCRLFRRHWSSLLDSHFIVKCAAWNNGYVKQKPKDRL